MRNSVLDLSWAHRNAYTDDAFLVYEELPHEDLGGHKGFCGELHVHMYSTRAAADG